MKDENGEKTKAIEKVGDHEEKEKVLIDEMILDISNELDLHTLCYKAMKNLLQLGNAERCTLYMVKSDEFHEPYLQTKYIDVTQSTSLQDALTGSQKYGDINISFSNGIAGHVARCGQSLTMPNAYEDSRFDKHMDELTGYRTESMATLPIFDRANNELIGVIQLMNKQTASCRIFTETDIACLENYLKFCGPAMANAQLFENTMLEKKQNELLTSLAQSLFVEQHNLERLLEKIASHSMGLVDVQQCSVFLLDSKADTETTSVTTTTSQYVSNASPPMILKADLSQKSSTKSTGSTGSSSSSTQPSHAINSNTILLCDINEDNNNHQALSQNNQQINIPVVNSTAIVGTTDAIIRLSNLTSSGAEDGNSSDTSYVLSTQDSSNSLLQDPTSEQLSCQTSDQEDRKRTENRKCKTNDNSKQGKKFSCCGLSVLDSVVIRENQKVQKSHTRDPLMLKLNHRTCDQLSACDISEQVIIADSKFSRALSLKKSCGSVEHAIEKIKIGKDNQSGDPDSHSVFASLVESKIAFYSSILKETVKINDVEGWLVGDGKYHLDISFPPDDILTKYREVRGVNLKRSLTSNDLKLRISRESNIGNRDSNDETVSNFDDAVPSINTSNILSIPVRSDAYKDEICAVVQLVNRQVASRDGRKLVPFTSQDVKLMESFAKFCGLSIHNTRFHESSTKMMAKQKIALDCLCYHATATDGMTDDLCKQVIPAASNFNLYSYKFIDSTLSDDESYKVVVRMFMEFNLIDQFHIPYKILCRWILSVKKNYRPVRYHNWRHAFSVTQSMFTILKTGKMDRFLNDLEVFGLLVACLCHDLDHRGTNNAFQTKMASPLAVLYSTSTLEHHHFDHCVMILSSDGNNIFQGLSTQEYKVVMKVLEDAILATDLALYFKRKDQFLDIANTGEIDWKDPWKRELLSSMLMTASDVASISKPWIHQHELARAVADEFFDQGDIERLRLHTQPVAMMDRDKKDELPQMQVGFIDIVCRPLYSTLSDSFPWMEPLLTGCLANREKWLDLAEKVEMGLTWIDHDKIEAPVEELCEETAEAKKLDFKVETLGCSHNVPGSSHVGQKSTLDVTLGRGNGTLIESIRQSCCVRKDKDSSNMKKSVDSKLGRKSAASNSDGSPNSNEKIKCSKKIFPIFHGSPSKSRSWNKICANTNNINIDRMSLQTALSTPNEPSLPISNSQNQQSENNVAPSKNSTPTPTNPSSGTPTSSTKKNFFNRRCSMRNSPSSTSCHYNNQSSNFSNKSENIRSSPKQGIGGKTKDELMCLNKVIVDDTNRHEQQEEKQPPPAVPSKASSMCRHNTLTSLLHRCGGKASHRSQQVSGGAGSASQENSQNN